MESRKEVLHDAATIDTHLRHGARAVPRGSRHVVTALLLLPWVTRPRVHMLMLLAALALIPLFLWCTRTSADDELAGMLPSPSGLACSAPVRRENEKRWYRRSGTTLGPEKGDAADVDRSPGDLVYGPIDVVFTWVNGSDPLFVREFERYGSKNSLGRYRDYETLRYALRSVEMFAPWVGTVFLVTNGQVPSWLDLSNKRIRLVTHKDIFEDPADLPTFSSHPIESHLHRIPDLNERFIYCNDDMAFGAQGVLFRALSDRANLGKEDFWEEPRATVVYRSSERIPRASEMVSSVWKRALVHSNHVLNSDPLIGEEPARFYPMHHCYSMRASVLREMSYRFRGEYLLTRSRRFRESDDITIPFLYANYIEHAGIPYRIVTDSSFIYMDITNNIPKLESKMRLIESQKPKFLCFNDQFGAEGPTEEVLKEFRRWMDRYYPTKSTFEK